MAIVVAAIALPCTAFAEHLAGSTNWTVTFNEKAKADNRLVDNYSEDEWADNVSKLQPGDDITFLITQIQDYKTAADWYLSNDVIKSLEDGTQSGSAYGYVLTYVNPSGNSRTLYDSATVGGDDSEGLKEATDALEDFIYLDTLKQGEKSQVKLVVTLDGETEGNAYFDTLAQLKMKFAVELNDNPSNPPTPNKPNTPKGTPVQTGDDTNLFPFFVAMTVSGALLLVIAIASLRSRRKRNQA